jgi:hypothetical protein
MLIKIKRTNFFHFGLLEFFIINSNFAMKFIRIIYKKKCKLYNYNIVIFFEMYPNLNSDALTNLFEEK